MTNLKETGSLSRRGREQRGFFPKLTAALLALLPEMVRRLVRTIFKEKQKTAFGLREKPAAPRENPTDEAAIPEESPQAPEEAPEKPAAAGATTEKTAGEAVPEKGNLPAVVKRTQLPALWDPNFQSIKD